MNNFCTWNPLDKDSDLDLSEGNTKMASSASGVVGVRSTFGMTDDKIYCEFMPQGIYAGYAQMGIETSKATLSSYPGKDAYGWGLHNLILYTNDTNTAVLTGTTPAVGDVIQMAYNGTTGKVWFGLNGTWYTLSGNVGVPATDAYPHISGLTGEWFFAAAPDDRSGDHNLIANFGQDSSFAGNKTAQGNQDGNNKGDFYYEPPSGFLALCTDNLSDPSIALPTDHFNTIIWSGESGQPARDFTGVGFQPDFNWTKCRNDTWEHILSDSVRGSSNIIKSNTSGAEVAQGSNQYGYIDEFLADGFSVAEGSSHAGQFNGAGDTFVSWNWKAGGAAASNTDGTITSSVSANTTAGFSIVSYTGTGSTATVGHGLSSTPEMVIVKNRSGNYSWPVTHHQMNSGSAPADNARMYLEGTGAYGVGSNLYDYSSFTNAVFAFNGGDHNLNFSSENYIAYCFHSVEGYSKVGSYTGNDSTDGTFLYCGFRPALIMVKRIDTSGTGWVLMDAVRNTYNVMNDSLLANSSAAENDARATMPLDFVSNGFKWRTNYSDVNGASGGTNHTYIYYAVAESPFKTSNAR
jgi:hypothetical protein